MRSLALVLSGVLCFVLLGSASVSAQVTQPAPPPLFSERAVTVIAVIDGDTIDIRDSLGDTLRVRLIGVNSPETKDPRKPVQCFGQQASEHLTALLLGKTVFLENDPSQGNKDKYGRLLRYAWLGNTLLDDKTLINLLVIQRGFAFEYTYRTPYAYQALFQEAQMTARMNNRGLWAQTACNGELKPANPVAESSTQPATSPTTTTTTDTSEAASQYSCSKKTCSKIATCEEAKFLLTQCGLKELDRDHDGIPCESLCLP